MKANQTQRKQLDQTMLAAIQKYLKTAPSLALLGTTYTLATLGAVFQGDIDESNASEAARAAWLVASKAANAKASAVLKVRRALQAYALATYGDSDDVRADWGMPPLRSATLTAATKAAAALKAAATRKARGTLGKRQKVRADFDDPCLPAFSRVELRAVA